MITVQIVLAYVVIISINALVSYLRQRSASLRRLPARERAIALLTPKKTIFSRFKKKPDTHKETKAMIDAMGWDET